MLTEGTLICKNCMDSKKRLVQQGRNNAPVKNPFFAQNLNNHSEFSHPFEFSYTGECLYEKSNRKIC